MAPEWLICTGVALLLASLIWASIGVGTSLVGVDGRSDVVSAVSAVPENGTLGSSVALSIRNEGPVTSALPTTGILEASLPGAGSVMIAQTAPVNLSVSASDAGETFVDKSTQGAATCQEGLQLDLPDGWTEGGSLNESIAYADDPNNHSAYVETSQGPGAIQSEVLLGNVSVWPSGGAGITFGTYRNDSVTIVPVARMPGYVVLALSEFEGQEGLVQLTASSPFVLVPSEIHLLSMDFEDGVHLTASVDHVPRLNVTLPTPISPSDGLQALFDSDGYMGFYGVVIPQLGGSSSLYILHSGICHWVTILPVEDTGPTGASLLTEEGAVATLVAPTSASLECLTPECSLPHLGVVEIVVTGPALGSEVLLTGAEFITLAPGSTLQLALPLPS